MAWSIDIVCNLCTPARKAAGKVRKAELRALR